MNPISWTKGNEVFYMRKLSYKDKMDIYNKVKSGYTIRQICSIYGTEYSNTRYLVKLIELHGTNIILENKNNNYTTDFKIFLVKQVLEENKAIFNVAVENGLSSRSILQKWIKIYKENNYNIVERKRGRSTMIKVIKKKSNETKDETIKRLEKENLYLRAELEYSKKLKAVVQARKNQQQKKK